MYSQMQNAFRMKQPPEFNSELFLSILSNRAAGHCMIAGDMFMSYKRASEYFNDNCNSGYQVERKSSKGIMRLPLDCLKAKAKDKNEKKKKKRDRVNHFSIFQLCSCLWYLISRIFFPTVSKRKGKFTRSFKQPVSLYISPPFPKILTESEY